jgi:hypothetical protein
MFVDLQKTEATAVSRKRKDKEGKEKEKKEKEKETNEDEAEEDEDEEEEEEKQPAKKARGTAKRTVAPKKESAGSRAAARPLKTKKSSSRGHK